MVGKVRPRSVGELRGSKQYFVLGVLVSRTLIHPRGVA